MNDIRDAILEEYEVEPDRCERDLLALLQEKGYDAEKQEKEV